MVVVSGTFNFPAGTADEVRAAMAAAVAETLKEDGCITYRFYADLEAADTYRVFEEWTSAEALRAHGKSAHLAAYRARLAELGIISRDVKLYQVEKSVQL